MDTQGTHLLAEYHGCPADALDDVKRVESILNDAAVAAGATVMQSAFHRFRPHGVSGVVILAESHLSVHTWPERGYAAVDLYTCGTVDAQAAHAWLARELRAERADLLWVERGLTERNGPSLRVKANG
ncbi:MAG: adenosylmethionine decarboxylase [Myxococcales bacterium]|nr:adenosylmethionine decarboxylase [Myxococcales bacterium]